MKQLAFTSRPRLALAALTAMATIVATIIAFASSSEAAAPKNCTYYSDWSRSLVVGQFGKDCCNNTVAWGVKTSYAECSTACLLCVPPPRD